MSILPGFLDVILLNMCLFHSLKLPFKTRFRKNNETTTRSTDYLDANHKYFVILMYSPLVNIYYHDLLIILSLIFCCCCDKIAWTKSNFERKDVFWFTFQGYSSSWRESQVDRGIKHHHMCMMRSRVLWTHEALCPHCHIPEGKQGTVAGSPHLN